MSPGEANKQPRFFELPQRTIIELAGADRISFLNSFCTANLKLAQSGQVTEAFVLNEKGKVIAFTHVLVLQDRLLVTCHGQLGTKLVEHLDRYLIREDVTLTDRSADNSCLLLPLSDSPTEAVVAYAGDWLPELDGVRETSGPQPMVLARAEFAGPALLVIVERSRHDQSVEQLNAAGFLPGSVEMLQAIRVAAGTPWSVVDIDESNLPQELNRDESAISFTKGCYLGQETVARLDAMGRVNWLFVQLELEDANVQAGATFESDGKQVLKVTSVAVGSLVDRPAPLIGLGYARRGFHETGTKIGPARVLGR